ncbi:MAG: hypothetical protein ACYC1Q_09390 [Bacteroidia bacterium]
MPEVKELFIQEWQPFELSEKLCGRPFGDLGDAKKCCKKYKRRGKRCKSCPDR